MEQTLIASFIVRLHVTHIDELTGEKEYRIKVTHVQDHLELLFDSLADAMEFMKKFM